MLCLASAAPARAAGALDRIRTEQVLHCGAFERAGMAEAPPTGGVTGVLVDVCRALAIAVLGPGGRVTFRIYEAPRSFDPARRGSDEVAFLTGGEIAEQDLGGLVMPGPTVAFTSIGIMVPDGSPVRHVAELADQVVCLMSGEAPQRALEAIAQARGLSFPRSAFQEDVEMLDAYNAGRCGAVVVEATYLAAMRQTPGVRRVTSRLLPETLADDPILAVTGLDAAWAARVAWIFAALLLADEPAGPWRAAGSAALPVKHLSGLRPDWPREMAAGVGGYATIIRRNLTQRSGLAAGPNALWPDGLLLPPAIR